MGWNGHDHAPGIVHRCHAADGHRAQFTDGDHRRTRRVLWVSTRVRDGPARVSDRDAGLLTAVSLVAAVIGAATLARIQGLAVDGVTSYNLALLRPEVVLLTMSLVAI